MAISDFLSVAKSLKDFWQFLRDTIAMAHYSHWLRVNSDQHDRKRRVRFVQYEKLLKNDRFLTLRKTRKSSFVNADNRRFS